MVGRIDNKMVILVSFPGHSHLQSLQYPNMEEEGLGDSVVCDIRGVLNNKGSQSPFLSIRATAFIGSINIARCLGCHGWVDMERELLLSGTSPCVSTCHHARKQISGLPYLHTGNDQRLEVERGKMVSCTPPI